MPVNPPFFEAPFAGLQGVASVQGDAAGRDSRALPEPGAGRAVWVRSPVWAETANGCAADNATVARATKLPRLMALAVSVDLSMILYPR